MSLHYLTNTITGLLVWCSYQLSAQSVSTIDQFRNKAEILYIRGDYDKALIYYLRGYHLARQLDTTRAANLAVDISSIYHMQGNYRRGVAICHEGAALLKRAVTQPDSVWFKLNSSLGEMYKKLNGQDSCYLYFARANRILQKHPELETYIDTYIIYHYNNQGMMYVREGAYTEGLSYLTKALSIAKKHTVSKQDIAILQNNLGEVNEQAGLFERALTLREIALEDYPQIDFYKAKIYNGASYAALQSESYHKAAVYAKNALLVINSLNNAAVSKAVLLEKIVSLNRLGDVYSAMNNYRKAVAHYGSAIRFYKKYVGFKGAILANGYIGLASVKKKQKNYLDALLLCKKATTALSNDAILYNGTISSKQTFSERTMFEVLVLKAELCSGQFNVDKKIENLQNSYSAYENAIGIADAMRKRYNTLETKWFFSAQVRPAYVKACETAYALYKYTQKIADKQQVFSLLERSKATALADITRESLIKPANIPADLLIREQTLQRTIAVQKLESTAVPTPKLIDAQIQLAQLQQRLEQEFSAYYQAKYQPQTVSIAQVQADLDERTAYLSYLLTADALYIAIMTRAGLMLVRKNDPDPLKQALKMLDTALYANPGLGNYKGTSAAITAYRWLIEPVRQLLKNTQRLIISPDGELHRLPFEVLETGRVVDDFLIRQYAISYVPSANSLLRQSNARSTRSTNTLLGLAPFVVPVGPGTSSLAYLPASQTEAEQLPGEMLLGKTATKSRFMRAYTNYDILHFATHAYADNAEPARSYIAFYPDGNLDKLYAGEIYNLSLPRTRMVVLSACETGNGKLQAGEGVMSLAQAFAYAGCPSVVSTLWGANDESAAFLGQQLYKHLQKGLPIDVALQQTRLDCFRSELYPKLNHPHYWANLILLGHSQPVYEPTLSVTGIVAGVVGLIMCASAVLIIRQRRWSRRSLADQLRN